MSTQPLHSWLFPPVRRVDADFISGGVRCAGTLLLPAHAAAPPVIVMAHGFGAIRKAGLKLFADRFVASGYAVFLFDYRGFGDSEGEPRQRICPSRQLQDWRAALAHVRALEQVDGKRLALWGVSFSGGHVIRLAAQDQRVSAVMALVPHVDGLASTMQLPLWTSTRLGLAALLDMLGGWLGLPHSVPIVGLPGECAALTSAGAREAYLSMLPPGARWENRTCARVFAALPFYSPIRHAHRVQAPALVIAASQDAITLASAAYRATQRMPKGRFELLHSDHFQPFSGVTFEACIARQLTFLRETLPASSIIRSSK